MTRQYSDDFQHRISEAQHKLKEKFVYYYAMRLLFDEMKYEFALLHEFDHLSTIAGIE